MTKSGVSWFNHSKLVSYRVDLLRHRILWKIDSSLLLCFLLFVTVIIFLVSSAIKYKLKLSLWFFCRFELNWSNSIRIQPKPSYSLLHRFVPTFFTKHSIFSGKQQFIEPAKNQRKLPKPQKFRFVYAREWAFLHGMELQYAFTLPRRDVGRRGNW